MSILNFSVVLTAPEEHTSGISVNDVTAYSVSYLRPDFLCVGIGNAIFGITYLPDFDPLRKLSATMSSWDDTSVSGLLPRTIYTFQVIQSQGPLDKSKNIQCARYALIYIYSCTSLLIS